MCGVTQKGNGITFEKLNLYGNLLLPCDSDYIKCVVFAVS